MNMKSESICKVIKYLYVYYRFCSISLRWNESSPKLKYSLMIYCLGTDALLV